MFKYKFTLCVQTIIWNSKIKKCNSKSMPVSLLFHKLTCMTVRLYIFYPYPKLAALFLNVIALFPKFRENFFMYVINKRVFLWKSKDSSNNTLTDNVSSRLTIVFCLKKLLARLFFFSKQNIT